MHHNSKQYIIATILLFLQLSVFAQDAPIEWEEIPKSDLEITSFPSDTNAAAVIICDYGESFINDDLEVEFNRHFRVKIFNEKGYDWGNHSIALYTEKGIEWIKDIEAVTYNLNPDGEIEATELDDDDIFKEEIDSKRTRYRFTMPNLKPGCVLEIRYKIGSSSYFMMKDWTFQHNIPTIWSEYRVTFPKNIVYAVVYQGYEPWFINESKEVNRNCKREAERIYGSFADFHQFRYAIRNAPALREEPFITTIDDYVNKLDVQLAGYSFPHTGKQDVLQNWETFTEDLFEDDNLGEKVEITGDIEDLAKKITEGLTSPEEKMEAIYKWVSVSLVWNGKYSIYAENDVDEVLELKKGNCAEINFVLLSLLKYAGIKSHPVILSTRGHGLLQELYPIHSQFNYSVAKAEIGNKTYFLDATDPLRPIDLLPEKILEVKGLVIKEGPVEWVTFSTDKNNTDKTLIVININEDGSINGRVEDSFGEYKSLDIREDISGKNDIDMVKELLNAESEGIVIDSAEIASKDEINEPLRLKGWYSSASYAQKIGDMIYLNPYIVHKIKSNPFKTPVRNFPIDYGYKNGKTTIINVILPEGYELKEKLENKNYYIGTSTSFTRNVMVNGNTIQLLYKMEIKEPKIKPVEYDKLKEFYSRVVSDMGEQLVIGKKETKAGTKDNSEAINLNPANQ